MSGRGMGPHQGMAKLKWEEATRFVRQVEAALSGTAFVKVAGSYRRRKEEVGDLDFVVRPDQGKDTRDVWTRCREAFGEPIVGGKWKEKRDGSVKIDQKAQWKLKWEAKEIIIDLYIANERNFETMLLYLTGSADTNKMMRWLAQQKGMVLSQHGLRKRLPDDTPGDLVGEQTEEGVHKTLGLVYQEPEKR